MILGTRVVSAVFRRFREGIATVEVTLTYRRWKRSQVGPGHIYRTAAGRIRVVSVGVVEASEVGERDAMCAGFATPDELLAQLPGEANLPLYRVEFVAVDEPDPRDDLAARGDDSG